MRGGRGRPGSRRGPGGGRASRRRAGRRGARALWFLILLAAAAAAVAVVRTLPRHGGPAGGVSGGGPSVQVYLVRYDPAGHAGRLTAVSRRAPGRGAETRLEAALRGLLDGPTPAEQSRGLVSEVPRGTVLRSVSVREGVATVDLSAAFGGGGGSSSMLARVWQVVYTATQLPEVNAVQILIDGRRVQALGGEGVVIGSPLRRPPAMPAF